MTCRTNSRPGRSRSHLRAALCVLGLVALGATAACQSTVDGHPTAGGAAPSMSAPGSSGGLPSGGAPSGGLPSGSAGPSAPGGSSAPGSSSAPSSPSPSASAAPIKPKIPGWLPVADHVRHIAYDVPPNWNRLNPTQSVNPGSDNRLKMFAGSTYRLGFCPSKAGTSRGITGIASAFQGSLEQVSHTLARFFAREVYANDAKNAHVTVGKTRSVSVPGAHAVETRTTITMAKNGACGAPKAIANVVVVNGGGSNGIFVLLADQGVASAISAKQIDQIMSSVRQV